MGGSGEQSDPGRTTPVREIERRCAWCSRPIDVEGKAGRPRRYCRQGCRQRAYEARQRSADMGLAADDVVIGRTQLDELASALYCLQAAIEDVDRDLADAGDDPRELRLALSWLMDNARPAAALWLEPRAAGDSVIPPGAS